VLNQLITGCLSLIARCDLLRQSFTNYGVFFFCGCTVHLDIIKVLLPTDAQKKCFEKSIEIYTKNAPKSFGVLTIIR